MRYSVDKDGIPYLPMDYPDPSYDNQRSEVSGADKTGQSNPYSCTRGLARSFGVALLNTCVAFSVVTDPGEHTVRR